MINKSHFEVAVIGGGIVGCAIAYYVAKAGLSVTVIERGDLASGTSSRCDGNILAIEKEPGFDSQMSLKSQQLMRGLSQELTLPFEYRAPGSILVCETEEEMEVAQRWVRRQNEAGLPFRLLDRQDIKQESAYFADDLLGGLECATDAMVNPYLLTFSLADGAKQNGAVILTQAEVTNTERMVGGSYRIQTTQGQLTAKQVVNAAGVWAPQVGKMVGIDIPIFPRKGHLIVASRQLPVGQRNVMEIGYLLSKFGGERKVDSETEKYGVALVFEPTESQNFLIGSSRQFVGFHASVDTNVVRAIARRAIRFYPKMAEMSTIRTFTGFRPWTEDHLPIVSRVTELPGYFIAAGHEGDGISLAAITGKLVAELITEQTETIIASEPLSYNRFSKKNV
ncbi:glycine oxidase [Brevibacillus reuszeri]|uniref:Aerobic glycerol-3-phosphate dehydrogenase n=1 Tax=Brevibacillus reuszeri TaxID=54915 RepID=A0A0K9YKR6_9BACL|nr:FAD-dependent oxidoreductase [Brevibacillus reuszeri]KNB69266.1 glycine oxidase [Brevibacillus reuszeri]MED1860211.1 FAD-dependent oxidoreductase [Brevibacillus reuszeri]GED71590.1 glycine oxidase [Brevibacillus reuszeri]